ncbi:MAG TPA: AbrB/MazE/SpoVT family DNA-binding domain-containing protein [Kofleriaceae bacterium]|nr:AbrB/MazE/SpoVT family DNA-binding domain-containing protein [Kofleriaceae bacterium]
MKLASSRLTAQAQISVPAEVRRRLALVAGSVLEWDDEGGKIVVRRGGRHSSQETHRAFFGASPRPRTLAELKAGLRRHIKDRHARR